MISADGGRQVLKIRDLAGGDVVVPLGKYEARWVFWKSDHRLIAGVFTSTDDLFGRPLHMEAAISRLIGFDSDGTHPVDLGEPASGFHGRGRMAHPQFQDNVVAVLEQDPHHILQSVIDQVAIRGVTPAVYRVDVDTGDRQILVQPDSKIGSFTADAAGNVRLASGFDAMEQHFYALDEEHRDWRDVYGIPILGDQIFQPLAFVPDQPNEIYVIVSGIASAKNGIWTFDIKAGRFDRLIDDAIADNPEADVRSGRLISYLASDGSRKYLDPAWARDIQGVQKALGGRRATIVDRLADGSRVLVRVGELHQPVSWWLLDRTVKPTRLSPVLKTYEDIVQAGVAPVEKVTYKARDGLEIPAYLTLPIGPRAGPIPFVVLPHGGPFACDGDGFDFVAQFIASRGWGVLQPEFRGSTCLGEAFMKRGFGEWGFAMQDDLTDGTRWLIEQKLADAARICIVGASYGGYAALEGVEKEPDLYRCAAAWAPVTELRMHASGLDRLGLLEFGDDPARRSEVSPNRHADRVKVPVLLMHGRNDFTVQVRESMDMEAALKHAGKSVEAIYLDGADHFFSQYPARLAWLQALDRFLGTNLETHPGG